MIKKFFKICYLLKRYIFTRDEIIIFEFPKNKISNFKVNPEITIRKVNKNNLKDILNFQNKKYIPIFKKFLKKKATGYYAYINNVCVHSICVKDNNQIVYPHWVYRYSWLHKYKLKNDEVFIHYAKTNSHYRDKGVYQSVLSKILEYFKEKVKLISINSKNIFSIKGVMKVGSRERESKYYCSVKNKDNKGPNVMMITQGLNPIVKPIIENYNVVGMIESAPRGYLKYSNKKVYFYKLLKFIRSKYNLEQFCKNMNVPYFFMTKCDESLEKWIKDKKPDVIVVYAMSQLLKENIFTIPKYGTINLHPSLLPKYRGPNPLFWQYYKMEEEVGITLHYIDKGEDTGDIIYQEKLEIPFGLKLNTLNSILIKLSIKIIFRALENIENLPRKKQPKTSPTLRAKNITLDEYKNLIDWNNWGIERLWHFFRGTEKWFNKLYKLTYGCKWLIENYEKCSIYGYEIGKIYKKKGKYFVTCKDGKIYLNKKFSIKVFINDIIRGIYNG